MEKVSMKISWWTGNYLVKERLFQFVMKSYSMETEVCQPHHVNRSRININYFTFLFFTESLENCFR